MEAVTTVVPGCVAVITFVVALIEAIDGVPSVKLIVPMVEPHAFKVVFGGAPPGHAYFPLETTEAGAHNSY